LGTTWLHAVADPIRLEIVRSLSQRPDMTISDLALKAVASEQTLRRHLEPLLNAGVVELQPGESDGETVGRPAARFRLREDVRRSVSRVLQTTVPLPDTR
jgi:predicted ArsR family transcriptional regulator